MLFWKKARYLWNEDLIQKMHKYNYSGHKPYNVNQYKKLNFVEKYMKETSMEEINSYNQSLGLIVKWMHLAIETRKKDILHRLSLSRHKR